MNKPDRTIKTEDTTTVMSLPAFLGLLLAVSAGALATALVLPVWLPGLSASLQGSAPHAFWFLSRTSAIVAYLLLWCSMCLGLLITNKLARLWPGGPAAFDIHQFTSLLGVAFALFHGLILLGDRYLNTTLWHLVIPFNMQEYRLVWVGLGQVGFLLMAVVAFSFYIRKQITPRRWRLIHFVSFAAFALALLHGIASGTDSTLPFMQMVYWGTGGVFLFLFVYRLLIIAFKPASARQVA
jgi:predicted ferric reductase